MVFEGLPNRAQVKFVKEDVEKAMAVDIRGRLDTESGPRSQVFAKSFLTPIHPGMVSIGEIHSGKLRSV